MSLTVPSNVLERVRATGTISQDEFLHVIQTSLTPGAELIERLGALFVAEGRQQAILSVELPEAEMPYLRRCLAADSIRTAYEQRFGGHLVYDDRSNQIGLFSEKAMAGADYQRMVTSDITTTVAETREKLPRAWSYLNQLQTAAAEAPNGIGFFCPAPHEDELEDILQTQRVLAPLHRRLASMQALGFTQLVFQNCHSGGAQANPTQPATNGTKNADTKTTQNSGTSAIKVNVAELAPELQHFASPEEQIKAQAPGLQHC